MARNATTHSGEFTPSHVLDPGVSAVACCLLCPLEHTGYLIEGDVTEQWLGAPRPADATSPIGFQYDLQHSAAPANLLWFGPRRAIASTHAPPLPAQSSLKEEQLIEALSPAPGATRYVSATNPLVLGGLDLGWHFYPKLYLNKGHLGGETMADGISAEALSAPPVLAPAL